MRGLWIAILLLVSALAGPALAQQDPATGELLVSDGEGDVSIQSAPPGTPGGPLRDSVDLRSLRIHSEDVEGLWIELGVKALRETVALAMFGPATFRLSFALERQMTYEAAIRAPGASANSTPEFSADFYARAASGAGTQQRVTLHTDYSRNVLSLFVPKTSLLGQNPSYPEHGTRMPTDIMLARGSPLQGFVVESAGMFMGDRLPNAATAGPYVMRESTANQLLRLSLGHGDENETEDERRQRMIWGDRSAIAEAGVEMGTPVPIRILVENRNDAKRVVNLSAEFVDPKDASRFSLRIARSLSVPANDTRTVNAVVTALPGVKHRDWAALRVHAWSLGVEDEIGAVTIRLVASVPPSPSSKFLYLHGSTPAESSTDPKCLGSFLSCYPTYWMNTLQEDPQANADKEPQTRSQFASFTEGWTNEFWFRLDAPLAHDLVLSGKLPVVAKVKVAGTSTEGSVRATLSADDFTIGEGNHAITSSSEPVEISFLPLAGATRVPSGSSLRLHIKIVVPHSSPQGTGLWPGLSLKESTVELPLIEDPNATAGVAPSLGQAFISLHVKGDREEFVNPSEARAFNLTLLNEGSIEDVVTMAAKVEGDGCRAEFRPGDTYRLPPGDSARFGILVHAPINPKEGAQCKVVVNATSRVDPATVASRDLLVTVTRGVDTPNDALNYTADKDAAQKLEQRASSRGSPGPTGILLVLAPLAVAWRLRRRSQL